MASVNTIYSGSATTLTITGAATLANGSSAVSATLTNTTTKYLDYLIMVSITTASGATATGLFEIWVKGSIDNTNFDDNTNDTWAGTLSLAAAGAQTVMKVVSVAPAFGGSLPPYVQVRLRNATGAALTAATVTYIGISGEVV